MIIVSVAPITAPPELPPVTAVRRSGVHFHWTGTDGSLWDLTQGPVTLQTGAQGLGFPTVEHWWERAPSLPGASWQGVAVPQRVAFMPVLLKAWDMLALERAWFAGLDPAGEGVLRATTPDGQWRECVLRYTEGGEGEWDIEPVLAGSSTYPLRMTAADPYWLGEEITQPFEFIEAEPFFPGPPFTLQSASSLASATITNPGDEPAYGRWRATGPFTALSLGVGSETVDITATKTAGQWIEIDMDPRRLTVLDNTGADLWESVTEAEFAAIPPGVQVELTTTVTGAESGTLVELSMRPRYRRAW